MSSDFTHCMLILEGTKEHQKGTPESKKRTVTIFSFNSNISKNRLNRSMQLSHNDYQYLRNIIQWSTQDWTTSIARFHEHTFNTFTKLFVNVSDRLKPLIFKSDRIYVFKTLSIMSQSLNLTHLSYVRKQSQNTNAYYVLTYYILLVYSFLQ